MRRGEVCNCRSGVCVGLHVRVLFDMRAGVFVVLVGVTPLRRMGIVRLAMLARTAVFSLIRMVKLSRNFVPFRGLAACALHLPRQAIALGGSRTEKHFRGNKKFCVWRPVLSWRNRADRRVARGVQALWDPRRKKVRKSCKSVDRARLRTETRIAGRGRREGF